MSVVPERPAPIIGLYDAPLWSFAANNELRLQRCNSCKHVRYFPTGYCPVCLSEDHEWALMSGKGRVASWCVFHKQYFPQIPAPYIVVMVELEEGPIVPANIINCQEEELKIGLSVHVVFEDVLWNDGTRGKIFQWRKESDPVSR